MVIYDPFDPHKLLYDVDGGKATFHLAPSSETDTELENTVITLTEWYHLPASQLPVPP